MITSKKSFWLQSIVFDKKIQDIFQRLNVLNIEDSLFELKTMHEMCIRDSIISEEGILWQKKKIVVKLL